MLEGRSNSGGWLVVAVAIVALVAFTGLLYVRGANGPSIPLSGSAATARPSGSAAAASGSPRPSGSGANVSARATGTTKSAAPTASTDSSAAATAVVAGATSRPTASPSPTPTRTPKPTLSPTEPTGASQGTGFNLPALPQAAAVQLENGQGGCDGFPTGGVTVETKFTVTSGRITATSPSNHRLSGRIDGAGAFTLSGTSPVERWVGTLTSTGGSGRYVVITNGCTQSYETAIRFHA